MANSSNNGSSNGSTESSSSRSSSSRSGSGSGSGSSSGSSRSSRSASGSSRSGRSSGSSSGRSSSSRSGSSRSGRSSRGGSSSSSRSRSGISSIPGQIGRSVIQPISRSVSRSSWMPYALGAVGLGLAIYGLSRVSAIRSFVSPSSSLDYDFGGSDIASDLDDSMGFDEDVRVIGSDLNSVNRAM